MNEELIAELDAFTALGSRYRMEQREMIQLREAADAAVEASRSAARKFEQTWQEFRRASEMLADALVAKGAQ